MADFNKALVYTLVNEGGFSDDSNDFGGATNFGITREDFSRWLRRPATVQDVKKMTESDAEQIYYSWYFTPLNILNVVSQGITTSIFDMGVNLGLHSSAAIAQTALNTLGFNLIADGSIGPVTLSALNLVNPNAFIRDFHDLVRDHYSTIVANDPTQEVFLKGWMNRCDRLLTLLTGPDTAVSQVS